jgi:hypothetical protein
MKRNQRDLSVADLGVGLNFDQGILVHILSFHASVAFRTLSRVFSRHNYVLPSYYSFCRDHGLRHRHRASPTAFRWHRRRSLKKK